jgi:antitoxin (DNA-binding transcriptional repressor) of toxin-antitoxin stability system
MATITMRELNHNAAAAVQRVLDSGEAAEVTAYGKPTGVVIAPAAPRKRRWVPGHELRDLPPLPKEEAEEWQREIREGRQYEFGRDFWQDDE